MVANTGTYLDTPFHRYADGDDLEAALELPLRRVAREPGLRGPVQPPQLLLDPGVIEHDGEDAIAHG